MNLDDFCFMPYSDARDDYRNHIAKVAIEEEWGQDYRHLRTYVVDNFEIAWQQEKVTEDPQKRFCLWRVGTLRTREGNPITILATKNRVSGRQPYCYRYTFDRERFSVRIDEDGADAPIQGNAPEEPTYDIPPYQPGYRLVYNFSHFLDDHEQRVEERFPQLSAHQRFLCIYAALELAHKRGTQAAVPQWYRDKNAEEGGYQWLLPLHVKSENISEKPDLVAVLHAIDEFEEYNIPTLLPPEWAYGHARAVSGRDPQFRSWA